jgi:hypothetical protein
LRAVVDPWVVGFSVRVAFGAQEKNQDALATPWFKVSTKYCSIIPAAGVVVEYSPEVVIAERGDSTAG